ncbi:MAG TPA: GNAT family N-acetyltransferase [Syntrophomonadaceae bacterium]|nr:GNAT family N-acetyltransferase [Syntrophomonadaceae bacterium]
MVELIQRIEPQLLKTLVDIEVSNFSTAAGLDERMLVPLIRHGRVFIIRHEDQIAGLCRYILDWEVQGKAYLVCISANNYARNKGLATSLLKDSISHLPREGIREVELTVSLDDKRQSLCIGKTRDLMSLNLKKMNMDRVSTG